jgi:preprotein translocase subunit SecD
MDFTLSLIYATVTMNRYPLWKYILISLVMLFGLIYTLPNFYGTAPAVQISSAKATQKITSQTLEQVNAILSKANVAPDLIYIDQTGIKARFTSPEAQIKAKDVLTAALIPDAKNPSYVLALNSLSGSPTWLTSLGAFPMYLGLDLRGGVHFLLEVDMKTALNKRYEGLLADMRRQLKEKNLRPSQISLNQQLITAQFSDSTTREAAEKLLRANNDELAVTVSENTLQLKLRPEAEKRLQDNALKQNINTLHNRINELGVAEPVIQQQGQDRIVVQLPGVQDTTKAKSILGRTATLEVRLVDESAEAQQGLANGYVPFGSEKMLDRTGQPIILKKDVILTGESLEDAQAGFESQTQEPTVNLKLDSKGAKIFQEVTRDNINKRMAILLVEKGIGEVVTAPVIRSEISGGRVQISGRMNTEEAADTALLLRAGSLSAPMEIIEERTIGPSLGADNIQKGMNSTLYGFIAIAVFMCGYYLMFGVFSVIALSTNLLLLVAVLSLLQATLTLPGIAAVALTLGMAIDANVLINERIREELRNGAHPQQAIATGFDKAFATILDSNITTLIAGVALLIFGSGAVRGFAVVHCLGILTSMFSAVLVARGAVNLWYGSRRKLTRIAIGQIWKAQ